jgi:hypothetical protein
MWTSLTAAASHHRVRPGGIILQGPLSQSVREFRFTRGRIVTDPAVTYASYLKIDELLALEEPRSQGPEHDELFFIVSIRYDPS